MDWLKSKTTLVAGSCLALIGFQSYGMVSMRNTMEERVRSVERELQSARNQDNAKVAQLAADFDLMTKRIGITSQDLQSANSFAEQLKQENAQMAQRLRREMSAKADAKAMLKYHEESNNKLTEVQQDATTKIAGITGDVQVVRTDLDATREELASSKRDLTTMIARNSTELAELRRRGEREYVEFDVRKSKQFQRIGDVMVQLKKTDVKKQKFDVVLNADDSEILKKDRTANEPVTFLVGRDRVRYEFVVNYVDKDRIRGYMSTPKDRLVAAESPNLRRLQ
jgi:chromosome segregation ATPase